MKAVPGGQKMGFNAAWAMAVGGMVGGGIFSVLGVVISIAGKWAWLSFVIGGLIALATGYSYSVLTERFSESGGLYAYLRSTKHRWFSGSLSWLLVFGYILTISVYAFTFGHYLAYAVGIGSWLPRLAALSISLTFIWVNLRGVKTASWVEIVIVWGKLLVLLVIAGYGLAKWQPELLSSGIPDENVANSLIGAASVFMAYEGFQLLVYDYDSIKNPRRNLPREIIWAIASVIVVYVAVAIGATMIVGAGVVVQEKEVAIATAGQAAFGTLGLVLATVAAVFSTGSAINATVFATARLTHDVAKNKELPGFFGRESRLGVPYIAVSVIGLAGAGLAMIGSIETLVEAASLIFLFTFATANVMAVIYVKRKIWIPALGAAGAAAAGLFLIWEIFRTSPLSLVLLLIVIFISTIARTFILGHMDRSASR
jgi:amino acid transporter